MLHLLVFTIRASENATTTQVMIITTMYFKNATVSQVPSLSLLHVFLSKLREEDPVSSTIMRWKRGREVSILISISPDSSIPVTYPQSTWLENMIFYH